MPCCYKHKFPVLTIMLKCPTLAINKNLDRKSTTHNDISRRLQRNSQIFIDVVDTVLSGRHGMPLHTVFLFITLKVQ